MKVANGWLAFENAAAGTKGNLCTAGLLTQLVGGGCGIHPSLAGQAVLALAVEEAIQGYRPPPCRDHRRARRAGVRPGPPYEVHLVRSRRDPLARRPLDGASGRAAMARARRHVAQEGRRRSPSRLRGRPRRSQLTWKASQ